MGHLRPLILGVLVLVLGACSHAPPQVVQVSSQVNRVWTPVEGAWSSRLSVFVQASSTDGNKVFDRLHLIHDGQQLFFTLNSSQWSVVERPGEYWVGTNDLVFPGPLPTGSWRAVLMTKSGQRIEAPFEVPPPAPDAPPARRGPVSVRAVPGILPGKFMVSGWVDDTLVWFKDAQGAVVSRAKVVGPEITVPPGTVSFVLYSYDKNRGEGIEAGPFPVQEPGKPADR